MRAACPYCWSLLDICCTALSHVWRCRRKYSQVFSEILGNERLLNDSRFHLTLIGQGQVELPPELAGKVTKLSNLDYKVWICFPKGLHMGDGGSRISDQPLEVSRRLADVVTAVCGVIRAVWHVLPVSAWACMVPAALPLPLYSAAWSEGP